jgi:hypothetical protein
MDSDEEGVPQHILNKIDRVFDAVTRPQHHLTSSDEVVAPVTVRRRRGEVALAMTGQSQGGGFIPPSPPPAVGGFIVEDDSGEPQRNTESDDATTYIPLAMIPSALQMLDLPPADEEVLEVFRNAAGGWDGSNDGQQGVSRKDWKSVCSILLSQQEQPRASSGDEIMRDETQPDEESSVEESDEEYRDPEQNGWVKGQQSGDEDEDEDEDEDDEYIRPSKQAADRKGKGKARPSAHAPRGKKRRRDSFEDDEDVPKSMTRRQKAACREAFALFFPDVEDRDLDSQRIMIKDIVRVSEVVKVRLTAEDVGPGCYLIIRQSVHSCIA